jgi:hypothetical protein
MEMRSRQETETKTIYECGVCGYSSYDGELGKKRALEHEEKHGQSVPFKVGDRVVFFTTEHGSDHGKDYTYGESHDGEIIEFAPEHPDTVKYHNPEWDGELKTEGDEYALVEEDDGSRTWTGVWDLRKWEPPEPEPERGELNVKIDPDLKFTNNTHSGGM